MIAGRFEEVRVPHKGNIQHDIIEGVYTVAEDFPRLIDASESMKTSPARGGGQERAMLRTSQTRLSSPMLRNSLVSRSSA